MTEHGTCTVVFSVIGMIVCFLFTLPRTLKNVSYCSVFSCGSIVVASTVAMTAIAIKKPGIGQIVTVRPGVSLVQGLGPVMNIILAYAGHVTFFGMFSELEDPRDFKKALAMTQIFTVSFYLLLAAVVYYFAGPLVASPALGSASYVVRKVAFGIALPTIVVAGVINGHVGCKYVYLRVCGAETAHKKSFSALAKWVGIVAGAWIIAFLIAEAIPSFNVLLGLIAALFTSWFSYGLPPVLWLYMYRGEWFVSKKRGMVTVLNMLLVVLGAAICGLGMWNSGYELARIQVSEVFSCKNNWKPSLDVGK
ncbi:putative amino acid transporter [Bimuria novae-zelandiae CBS 107.79]|uniref:Putative amino acid transporter n=1 Tax=Bimuria novae-zelandiae CBS 107.79 TaxID=1447943 RepID=A0A6A5VM68_9PLEO|nr:putative amino acid transporter [Bimuria novae-zelandiae CBS 107.79]